MRYPDPASSKSIPDNVVPSTENWTAETLGVAGVVTGDERSKVALTLPCPPFSDVLEISPSFHIALLLSGDLIATRWASMLCMSKSFQIKVGNNNSYLLTDFKFIMHHAVCRNQLLFYSSHREQVKFYFIFSH